MEIERKWLVDKDKCPILSEYSKVLRIVQGYLNDSSDEWIIRVRAIDNSEFILELKSIGLLSREELKFCISEDEYLDAIKQCRNIVYKTRYIQSIDNYHYEVDVYDYHDFVTCEVEFSSEKEAKKFKAPEWCIKDVTYDPKYKNVNLIY